MYGGEYAPFVIPSYTKVEGDALSLYFTISTWNPYQVVLMRTRVRPGRWWEIWLIETRLLSRLLP